MSGRARSGVDLLATSRCAPPLARTHAARQSRPGVAAAPLSANDRCKLIEPAIVKMDSPDEQRTRT